MITKKEFKQTLWYIASVLSLLVLMSPFFLIMFGLSGAVFFIVGMKYGMALGIAAFVVVCVPNAMVATFYMKTIEPTLEKVADYFIERINECS